MHGLDPGGNIMKQILAVTAVLLLGVLVLSACTKPQVDQPVTSGGTAETSGTGSTGSSANAGGPEQGTAAKGNSPVGTWYEQNISGDILEVTKNKISCRSSVSDYVFETKYKTRKEKDKLLLETEDEFYVYVDMYYDAKEDILYGHTMPHTDGDGGYHLIEFRRTVYVAPPAPTYPAPVDNSDPAAQKEFADLTIKSMKVSFYDEGVPYDINSSMAPQPPFADDYSYELEVLEDGSGRVSSSFCQEISISGETVDQLQEMFREADLGSINGLDIHTEGVPEDSPKYEAEFVLKSGETIRSSANWANVPENWKSFQKEMHYLLFDAFVDAGYNTGSGEFHSTEPMKRLAASDEQKNDFGISFENIRITPDWKKSFEYSLDTQYFKFSGADAEHAALQKTLDELSDKYKALAEEYLKKDYQAMEAVPKSVWKKEDRRFCYSLFCVDRFAANDRLFTFLVSTGHMNSLGQGYAGHGMYENVNYTIDSKTGRILSVGDLFRDADEFSTFLCDRLQNKWGTHNIEGQTIHADDFPQRLRECIGKTGEEGIGVTIGYHELTLWFPKELMHSESSVMERIYYDEIQEILNDQYCEVW